jgi:Cu/Ag efflux protein CusF
MARKYLRINDQEQALILAALRHWQQTVEYGRIPSYVFDYFKGTEPLDDHGIDTLCEDITMNTETETTQPLATLPKKGTSADAHLHMQSLYGEAVLATVVEDMKQGIKVTLRHQELKPLSYAAAALEFQRSLQAKASKQKLERMMLAIYDYTEVVVDNSYIPALEDGEAACRAITERFLKPTTRRR